jgi:hypothetical protein
MKTVSLLSRQLDRRAFLSGAGFTAGAVVACSLVPLSIVHALPSEESIALTPATGDPSWSGHVDDACGHWPPYAHSIPYGVARAPQAVVVAAGSAATVEPIDYILMV